LAQLNRVANGHLRLSVVLSVVLVVALVALDVGVLLTNNPMLIFHPQFYLALGDSISFGYQPNLDFTDGYVDDVGAALLAANRTEDVVNYACAGESTTTMIKGNCLVHLVHHNAYSGPQLDAAVSFLHAHSGHVLPVTLAIGANDVLPDWDTSTCTALPNATADLDALDTNLTQTILPKLIAAQSVPLATVGPSFLLLNYYNPFARVCPSSLVFLHELNDHLATDAAQLHIPMVDVYTAFGGDDHMADNLCTYTWVCNSSVHNDFHPTSTGYQVIAHAVDQALGMKVGHIGGRDLTGQARALASGDIWRRAF
jgi:lysophospholipase L1-like esterase